MFWTHDPQVAAIVLGAALLLFTARVAGQVLVVLFSPPWLPSVEQWQSGILPYPVLFASQVLIIVAMTIVTVQFASGDGVLVEPRSPHWGAAVLALSVVYFAGMVVRYVVSMKRHPERRWRGKTIPIIFHCVLASFLFVGGTYHLA